MSSPPRDSFIDQVESHQFVLETLITLIGPGGIAGDTALFDNGTSGDVTAGDGLFSRLVTVASGTSAGAKTLPATVTDAQGRSGTANVSLTVRVVAPPTPPTVTAAFVEPGPLRRHMAVAVLVRVAPGTNPTSTGLQVTMNLSLFGRAASTALSDEGGRACDQTAGDLLFTACVVVPPGAAIGPITLTGTVRDAQGRTAPVTIATAIANPADGDTDGLDDQCEATFGLNLSSGAGDDGAGGDPDGDELTNAQERQAGTHPRGLFRRYLAEGVTNAVFRTRIALFNPSATPTRALVRIQPEGAPERSLLVAMQGQERRTLLPEDTTTGIDAPFATVVESDVELVVDRLMTWGTGSYGSHAETAVHEPSTTWFLAEGATGWRFSLFYLLQNPSDSDALVEVSYLSPSPTRWRTGPRSSCRTAWRRTAARRSGWMRSRGSAGRRCRRAFMRIGRSWRSARCGGRTPVNPGARRTSAPGRRSRDRAGRSRTSSWEGRSPRTPIC